MTPLTEEELMTPLWCRLRIELEEALSNEREANDYPSDEITTATRRGKIEAYKELLDLQQRS